MSIERREGKLKEQPKIIAVNTPQDVENYFNFADKELNVEWGSLGRPESYSPENVLAHPDQIQLFVIKNENGEIIAGGVAGLLDEETKFRLGLNRGELVLKNGALLEYAAVKDENRNKGLNFEITRKREEWAKEHGAEYACAELEITNPISVWVKLRDGYKLVDARKAGAGIHNPYFVAVKEFVPEKVKEESTGPEYKEIEINKLSYGELKDLFDQGWVGVDIKGLEDDPEHLKNSWTLVLEK